MSRAGSSPRLVESAAPETAVIYDTTAPKPVQARDWLEQLAYERGLDLKLVDRLLDAHTRTPGFERPARPPVPEGTRIAPDVPILADVPDPFPKPVELPPKEITIRVGVSRSTYRTRTRPEVLAAVAPFVDLVQREVNIRGQAVLHESAESMYQALLSGQEQMAIAHVFDYLLIRAWFERIGNNATVMLAVALPANPRTTEMDRDFPGIAGTSIEIVVAQDAPYQTFADLKGKRLALAARHVDGPGTFLTQLLRGADQPADEPYFSGVTLRRYPKDAVIDVIKGVADAACVGQGTIGALDRFYGLSGRVRTIAVSPRYNVDVLFTTLNNLATHRTEIELTQRQLLTLGKDPEGEEILFFFDTAQWLNYRRGQIDVPRDNFADFVGLLTQTPVDLQALLDPDAPASAETYDRYGDL